MILIFQYLYDGPSVLYQKFLDYCKMESYFKSHTVIFEEKIDETNSLLCGHPHGILSFSVAIFLIKHMKNVSLCGTRLVRLMPFSGLLARMIGVKQVDAKSFKTFMQNNKNIFVIPGGFECATITNFNQDRVFIKNRKGFIKYALQYGYKLYPCYSFNENKLYYTLNGFEKIGMFLNKWKLPGCIFIGRYGLLPRNDIDLCTVFGNSLTFPIIADPSKKEIDYYHSIYVEELVKLYKKYSKEFGTSENLEIY